MASDVERAVKKILSLSRQTTEMTSEVLKDMIQTFLSGKADKTGQITLRDLNLRAAVQGGKLESIEISDQNIGDFLTVAKKYDVDFALKRDPVSGTFHVMFQALSTDALKRAFTEYAGIKQQALEKQPVTTRQQMRDMAKRIEQEHPQQRKERVREKSQNMSL